MKKMIITLLAVTAFALPPIASSAVELPKPDATWEKLGEDDGVTTHRKSVEGSDLVAFRGETTIDAPIAKVANVLIDTSRKKEWVFRIMDAKDIRPIGEFERIEYNHTASGFFLVRDRDFVFHAKTELDKANHRASFILKSVEDPAMPPTDKVRGSIEKASYILTSLDGDKRTHIVVEVHVDPKGSVPKWLVNLFQKSWPVKTLRGIAKQCAKPDVLEHPGIKKFFSGT